MTYIGLRPGITWCLRRDISLFLNYCHVWVNWVVILFAFWMDPLNCRRRNLGNCFWHSSNVIMRLLYFFHIFFWDVLSFELPILPLSSLYLVNPSILLTRLTSVSNHWTLQIVIFKNSIFFTYLLQLTQYTSSHTLFSNSEWEILHPIYHITKGCSWNFLKVSEVSVGNWSDKFV